MKRMIGVIIALVFLYSIVALPSSAYQTTNYRMASDHLLFHCDHNGAYLMNYSGSEAHLEKLAPDAYGAEIRLEKSISAAGVFDDTFVLLCNNTANHQMEVFTYRADTDVLDSFAVNDIRVYADRGFCYDHGDLYLIPDRNDNVIERYNATGKRTGSYTFDSDIVQLDSDYCGNIFAICSDTLYSMNGNRFVACSGSSITAPVSWFDNTHFSDAAGRITELSGGNCRQLFKADADYGRHSACLSEGIVYYSCGKNIFGYDLGSGKKISVFSADNTVTDLYTNSGYIYALSVNGSPIVNKIRPDEFEEIRESTTNTPGSGSNSSDGGQPVSSSVYRVDYNSYSINGIESGTTLAQFKKNMDYDGYTVSFYRDGSQKTDGNCGTAMTAVFESERCQYTFELSVIGDITGEGNVNSRDLSLLTEYLIGSADFNGVYITSADLSGDGRIDVKDLALMHRMI